MNITIEIPDEMNRELANIKDIDTFLLKAIKTALEAQSPPPTDDSLLSLNGILAYEKNDIGERHDEYIGQAIKNG